MQTEDIETVYKMGSKSKDFAVSEISTFWSKEELHQWINNNQDVLLVAKENGRIIGFIMSQIHTPTDKATIENIYMDERYRRRGIGAKLFKECLKRLKEKKVTYICICTMVKTENKPTIKFLKSLGFKRGYNFMWMEMYLQ